MSVRKIQHVELFISQIVFVLSENVVLDHEVDPLTLKIEIFLIMAVFQ